MQNVFMHKIVIYILVKQEVIRTMVKSAQAPFSFYKKQYGKYKTLVLHKVLDSRGMDRGRLAKV